MGKLFINEEGFVDLRRNPPATRVQVQGGIEAPEPVAAVEVVQEPPAEPKVDEVLPGRQKTTEGLELVIAPPVAVKSKKPVVLKRIESSEGEKCYAIVGANAFKKLSSWHWIGVRSGHMYRKVVSGSGVVTIIWLHREAANCNRSDRFVGFLDGDERNLHHSNLRICESKEAAKAICRQAIGRSANATTR